MPISSLRAFGRSTKVIGTNTTTYSYDYEDRLTSISYPGGASNSFRYNGMDARTSRRDSVGTATFKRDGEGVTDNVLSDGSAAYTPGVSERRSGATRTYHLDRMGTVRRQSDSTQTVLNSRAYDAFWVLMGSSGTTNTPFGFIGGQGYQEDGDSGLMLLGHRYYDPNTGRFLTRDSAKDGRNWYSYCANNPLKFSDPKGRNPLLAVAAVLIALYGLYELAKWAGEKINEGRKAKLRRNQQIIDSGDSDANGSGGGVGDHSGVGGPNPTPPSLGGPIRQPIEDLR